MRVYTTVEQLRGQIGKERDVDDAALLDLIAWASESVDRFCRRSRDGFLAVEVATAREFTTTHPRHVFIDECTEVSMVEVRDRGGVYAEWGADDWVAAWGDPSRPRFDHVPYTLLLVSPYGTRTAFAMSGVSTPPAPTVRVTARWGYADEVPGVVVAATIMQAARWHRRLEGSMGSVVGNPDYGTMLTYRDLDPDVQHLLVSGGLVRASG